MIRTQRYAFQRGGPKRLALRIDVNVLAGTWDDLEVRMDAVVIGRTTRAALFDGVEYKLFDGSTLRLWLEPAPSGPPVMNVTRNGHPLPGSSGDPLFMLRSTVGALWLFSGLQILGCVVAILGDRNQGEPTGVHFAVLATGAIIALLCVLAWHRSLFALVTACVLFVGQILLWFALHPHLSIALQGLFPMIGMVWLMLRAIHSLIDLKARALPVRRPPRAA